MLYAFDGDTVCIPTSESCIQDPQQSDIHKRILSAHPLPALNYYYRIVKSSIISHWQRSGTNQTHIPSDNIEQLRQFINTTSSQEFTYACDTRIVFYFEHRATHFVIIFELGLLFLSFFDHGSELVKLKTSFVVANSFLDEEDRPRRSEFNGNSNNYKKRK